jgi:hypothetical protein
MDNRAQRRFYCSVRQVVEAIRLRFHECQRADASLEALRALQLEILNVAKNLERGSAEQHAPAGRSTAESRGSLWSMLGDSVWLERDPTRLTRMIEFVLVELERHGRTAPANS